MVETIFVIGATGNIGTSAVQAALSAGYHVLATVRNAASAAKLFRNLGGEKDGVTTVEVDCVSDTGVQSVVDRVRAGELPAFQHVYACGMFGSCLISSSDFWSCFFSLGGWCVI